jgi:hypothetical protein
MKRIIAFLCVCVLLVSSCKKNENYICYSIEQTQCADPWGYGNNDMGTVDSLRNYLLDNGIEADKIVLKTTSAGESCLACTCKSGKTFFITAPEQNASALLQQGFVEGDCE